MTLEDFDRPQFMSSASLLICHANVAISAQFSPSQAELGGQKNQAKSKSTKHSGIPPWHGRPVDFFLMYNIPALEVVRLEEA